MSVLAACDPAGGRGVSSDSPFAPGVDPDGVAVDGLTVGHRLMAAGEYDLALEEYYRAAAEQGINVDVLSAVGSANLQLGRLGQAENILREAIELDDTFAPAWNNLGVVLMERGKYAEASNVFRTAFALDSGESAEIRDNLSLALEKVEDPGYVIDDSEFALVRRGKGDFELLATP
ncbi:MAG: tetratricopeptide repeat protein [Rhodobacteraceae bacterium]|nr:tetratricopeptide repeat protein [Paracoccaceae bacterium]